MVYVSSIKKYLILRMKGKTMSPIPDFTDGYHLPAGEHLCTCVEISDRFLDTKTRKTRWSSFIAMLERMKALKIMPEVILVNGSFVTGRREPGDVDFACLIPPDTIREALKTDDDHDRAGVVYFLDPDNQGVLRNAFGAHLLVAHDELNLSWWSKLFRFGQNGVLREPDPKLDPDWVTRPKEKGILKICKDDILRYIGGDEK